MKTKNAYTITHLSKPCRNFNFLASLLIDDPRDGREKFIISNYCGGGNGSLIFIDAMTEAAEVILLPDDEGAWALLCYRNEKLIVGTNSRHGYICSLDLKTREWAKPMRHEENTYIWSVAEGSDGMVYCGTYRSGSLVRYDPQRNTTTGLGCPSNNPGNYYCRQVRGELPGYILVTGGFATAFLAAWNIQGGGWTMVAEEDGKDKFIFREITEDYICVERAGGLLCYDSSSFKPIDVPENLRSRLGAMSIAGTGQVQPQLSWKLRDGRLIGVEGQEYFIEEAAGGTRQYKRIPTEPPPTYMRTLALDAKGDVWGACGFGQTIFRYGVKDESIWNSLAVTKWMGEVYGMVFVDGLLYLSCYAGGDHVVYDPEKPWDQRGNVNPKTLKSVYPYLQRPRANNVLGPDGGVWTGWSAKYGAHGGGLSRVDTQTHEVNEWLDPIKGQQVMGISADDTFIYFTTNCGGEGVPLTDENEPGWFCIWHPRDGMVAKFALAKGTAVGKLLVVNNKALIVEGDGLQVFDLLKRTFIKKIDVGEAVFHLVNMGGNKAAALCHNTLKIIDCEEGIVKLDVEIPGDLLHAAAAPDGGLYVAVEADLYKIDFDDVCFG